MDLGNPEHGIERAGPCVGIVIVGHWEFLYVGQSVWITHMNLQRKLLHRKKFVKNKKVI